MAGPALAARIEQPYTPSVERITRPNLRAFEAIAHAARQPEVSFVVGPTTCLGDDVVNF